MGDVVGVSTLGQHEDTGVSSVEDGEPLAGFEQKSDVMGIPVNSFHSGCCVQNRLKGVRVEGTLIRGLLQLSKMERMVLDQGGSCEGGVEWWVLGIF